MSILLISIAVFVAVTAVIGAVAVMLREGSEARVDDRLELLAGVRRSAGNPMQAAQKSLLQQAIGEKPGFFESLVTRFGKLKLLFDQANTSLTPTRFAIASVVIAVAGLVIAIVSQCPGPMQPLVAVMAGFLPLFWLLWRRKRRFKLFASQLPDALELIGRALRAGHSLGAGFHLVSEEMPAPIGEEFSRVFEEQNLGVAMEDALRSMTVRLPNLDLKFFVTAVILQRQTGGDLAEILDKIGSLIRARFKIWGQVQALTGEGRLSGVVLLGLPPVLFLAVYRLNPDYITVLFTDPMGKKMLAGAIFLQLVGALVIRKIVNIKV